MVAARGESAPNSGVRQSNRSISFFNVCISIRNIDKHTILVRKQRAILFVRRLSRDVEYTRAIGSLNVEVNAQDFPPVRAVQGQEGVRRESLSRKDRENPDFCYVQSLPQRVPLYGLDSGWCMYSRLLVRG